MINFKKILLPIIVFLGAFSGFVFCVLLQIKKKVFLGWFFVFLITAHIGIRVWETFFTSKDKDRFSFSEDWTLVLVTVVYIGFCFFVVFEFFFIPKKPIWIITSVGFLIYFLSYRLRWWGMVSLGKQWAIHAVGGKKITQTRLLVLGPYKYIRHPIYLSILFDQIGLILITNAFFCFFYFLIISIPAYFIRMIFEEKDNLKLFGSKYKEYKQKVGMILPK